MSGLQFADPKEKKALFLIRTLNERGHSAYFVGGYVRDKLLGRPIKDIDIATSALPEQVMALFERAKPTGIRHGTVTVFMDRDMFEVTTFRKESVYEDYRRPRDVFYVSELGEDLKRRDFTINAMALDAQGRLIDPFNGRADMDARILRCVGNPEERFREDALRMLRCIRFAAEYNMDIEPQTWNALFMHRGLLKHIAMERVGQELEKMMDGSDPARALRLLAQSGLLRHTKRPLFLPFAEPFAEAYDLCFRRLSCLPPGYRRWALVFLACSAEPAHAREQMKRLAYSSRKGDAVFRLLTVEKRLKPFFQMADTTGMAERMKTAWKRAAVQLGKSSLLEWAEVRSLLEQTPCGATSFEPGLKLFIENGREWAEEIPVQSVRDLAVDGKMLQQTFRRPAGPWIGIVLNRLYTEVVLGRLQNTPQDLIARARNLQFRVDE